MSEDTVDNQVRTVKFPLSPERLQALIQRYTSVSHELYRLILAPINHPEDEVVYSVEESEGENTLRWREREERVFRLRMERGAMELSLAAHTRGGNLPDTVVMMIRKGLLEHYEAESSDLS